MDGKQFGSDIVETVRGFMDRSMGPVVARLEALEKRLDALPAPRDGKDADPVAVAEIAVQQLGPALDEIRKEILDIQKPVIAALVPVISEQIQTDIAKAVAAIPVPKNGEPGKSVSVDDVAPLIRAEVEKTVSAIEVRDGRDGVGLAGAMIDRDGNLVVTLTDGAAKTLGPVCGRDGSSVTLNDVLPYIGSEIEKRVSEIELPRDGVDGKSVTPEDVAPMIAAEVQKAVSALPPPAPGEPGKSLTPEDVAPLISAEVEKAVSAEIAKIPVPKDGEPGKPADPEEVRAMVEGAVADAVAAAVADIRIPRDGVDGKSVTVEEITPIVLAEVGRLVSEFPVPENGKSVTVEDVAPLIEETVAKHVAGIPVPKDGVGLAGALIDREGNLAITLTDGSVKSLGPVCGRDGEPGKPGEPGTDGKDGRDGKDADPDLIPELVSLPDELNERIAKAVRLMAEMPVLETAAAAYQHSLPVVAQKSQPDIHVHMPDLKDMKVEVKAEIPPQQIVVENKLPPPRKTRTVVEEHDARGRVKKFRQEEIE